MDDASDPATAGSGAVLSKHPWLAFALIGLLPVLVLGSGSVLVTLEGFAALFPAMAAVLIAESGAVHDAVPGHRTKRVLVAVGVVAVLGGTRIAHQGLSSPGYAAIVIGVPAVLSAWVLSGVYAPIPAVRRLVRALVAPRASVAAWLVAALAWPVAAGFAAALMSRQHGVSVDLSGWLPDLGMLAAWMIVAAFNAALAALAWYGFAARRLLGRLSPLLVGLLVGAVQWLIVWAPSLLWNSSLSPFFLSGLVGSAAAGVAGVWVYGRSQGSLLPVWLLGTLLYASRVALMVAVRLGVSTRVDSENLAWAAAEIAVAAVLVVAGRMWRRPRGMPASSPTPEAPRSDVSLS